MPEPTSTAGLIAGFLASNEGAGRASLFIGGLVGGLIRLSFQKQVRIRAAWIPLLGIAALADVFAYILADLVGQPQFSFGSAVMMGIFGIEFVAMCWRMLLNLDAATIIGNGVSKIFEAISTRISGSK